jgi:predicted transposase YbfD/YdcC
VVTIVVVEAVATVVEAVATVVEASKIPPQHLQLNHSNSSLKAIKAHSNFSRNRRPRKTHHQQHLPWMMISLFNVHTNQTNFNLTLFH